MSSGVPTVDDHFQNHCSGHKRRHPPANPSNKVNSSCVEVCLTCVMPGGATKSRGEGCGRRKGRGHQRNPCTPNLMEKNHQKEQLSDSCIHTCHQASSRADALRGVIRQEGLLLGMHFLPSPSRQGTPNPGTGPAPRTCMSGASDVAHAQ